ncbi:MAG TPA: 4-hydroxybenzoate octaprenyltransferase [Syntrophaceae bacterium]|nr:4-hydroxybenzoate octaprenyltransferase [Syntrophaceae bacterium]
MGLLGQVIRKVILILEMIKFEHTIFALPFAFMGAILARHEIPSLNKVLWILMAMVGARSAAMASNRLIDAQLDAQNPRTQMRALPQGLISKKTVKAFIATSSILFFVSAYKLNRLAFYLSPLALIIVLLYPYTKRFTWACHIYLGLCLGMAPVGGWIAISGTLEPLPLLLGLGVIFWVAGFDILYAALDYEFDKKVGIYSLPVHVGMRKALWISSFLHFITFLCFLLIGYWAHLGKAYFYGMGVIFLILIVEHAIISPSDLSRVNHSFFTFNGIISVLLLVVTVMGL